MFSRINYNLLSVSFIASILKIWKLQKIVKNVKKWTNKNAAYQLLLLSQIFHDIVKAPFFKESLWVRAILLVASGPHANR